MEHTKVIEVPPLSVEAGLTPWDAAACGFPVAQIVRLRMDGTPGSGLRQAWGEFEAWRDAHHVRMVSCRLPAEQLAEGMWLESVGFRFVEMMLQPHVDLPCAAATEDPALGVSRATPDELPTIGRMARTAFVTDRFSVDPRLGPEVAGIRYERWVRSALDHPVQRLWSITESGRILGFFITELRSDGTCYWHLTAVDPQQQGLGYGRRIWRRMLAHAHSEGALRVSTLVAARNLPVVNLYASLGFRFRNPSFTYHWIQD